MWAYTRVSTRDQNSQLQLAWADSTGRRNTSIAFGRRCEQAGVRPSTGRTGTCFDNATTESFFASLECELIDRWTFRTGSEAERAVFAYIEGFCTPRRRLSGKVR
ncbi:hypothetical protein GCM10009525_51840 [Streptosporangium amethystogenes subsp. fukuiense]